MAINSHEFQGLVKSKKQKPETKPKVSRSKRSTKGNPMPNPLSYPQRIGYSV